MAVSGFDLFGGGKAIKSVQRGILEVTGNMNSPQIVQIDNVDASKSIVMISQTGTGWEANHTMVLARLISNYELELKKHAGFNVATVSWTVIEFEDATVQSGIFEESFFSTIDVPLNPVDLDKALVFFSFLTDSTDDHISVALLAGGLTSNSNLRFIAEPTRGTTIVQWYVVELS